MRHLLPQLPELLADCALRLALDEFGADDEQQGEWAGGGDDGVEMNAQSSPAIGEADGGSRSQLVQSQGSPQSASV